MPIQPAQQLRQRVVDLLFAGCLPTHEDGFSERTIIIEFASVEQADQPNISGDNKQIIDGRMKT